MGVQIASGIVCISELESRIRRNGDDVWRPQSYRGTNLLDWRRATNSNLEVAPHKIIYFDHDLKGTGKLGTFAVLIEFVLLTNELYGLVR